MTFGKIVIYTFSTWKLKKAKKKYYSNKPVDLLEINAFPEKKHLLRWNPYQSFAIHSGECDSSPTKMKHESQVNHADILVVLFLKRAYYGLKLGNIETGWYAYVILRYLW